MTKPTTTSLDLVGTAEAARILGNLDKSTITRWAADGTLKLAARLPGSGAGGALLFYRADVEKLAAERAREAETAEQSA